MTWEDFITPTGQLAILIALTGLLYRLGRLVWPDMPEPVMQFVAAILASVSNLIISYTPEIALYKWVALGIASGILLSQNVVKSIDWITTAATKTGAPALGIPEKPPEWYVDLHPELFPKETSKRDQAAARAGVTESARPQTFAERREVAAEMQKPTPPSAARTAQEVLAQQAAEVRQRPAVTPNRVEGG